jgi:hypothetical protein
MKRRCAAEIAGFAIPSYFHGNESVAAWAVKAVVVFALFHHFFAIGADGSGKVFLIHWGVSRRSYPDAWVRIPR